MIDGPVRQALDVGGREQTAAASARPDAGELSSAHIGVDGLGLHLEPAGDLHRRQVILVTLWRHPPVLRAVMLTGSTLTILDRDSTLSYDNHSGWSDRSTPGAAQRHRDRDRARRRPGRRRLLSLPAVLRDRPGSLEDGRGRVVPAVRGSSSDRLGADRLPRRTGAAAGAAGRSTGRAAGHRGGWSRLQPAGGIAIRLVRAGRGAAVAADVGRGPRAA